MSISRPATHPTRAHLCALAPSPELRERIKKQFPLFAIARSDSPRYRSSSRSAFPYALE